jgi:hypothetical protein
MSRRLSLVFLAAVTVVALAIFFTKTRTAHGKESNEDPACFASHLGLPCN